MTNLSFARKTDGVINVKVSNKDGSNISLGTHIFYLTIRKAYPPTSVNTDADAIIAKTITATVSTTITSLTVSFSLSETELNIDPQDYVYDIKWTDPNNKTSQIAVGKFIISVDSTRGNST
jgi:hypothetical protein